MNIPNMLTILRIIFVPIYLYIFYTFEKNKLLYSGVVFILAGLSDVLDGHIARKYNKTTKLGAVLDPLADKLMSFAVLVSFTSAKIIPKWIVYILGLKELIMIIGASILYLFKGNKILPSNKFGKIATLSFYISIFSVLLRIPSSIIEVLFKTTVALNILAFINYLIIFVRIKDVNNYS